MSGKRKRHGGEKKNAEKEEEEEEEFIPGVEGLVKLYSEGCKKWTKLLKDPIRDYMVPRQEVIMGAFRDDMGAPTTLLLLFPIEIILGEGDYETRIVVSWEWFMEAEEQSFLYAFFSHPGMWKDTDKLTDTITEDHPYPTVHLFRKNSPTSSFSIADMMLFFWCCWMNMLINKEAPGAGYWHMNEKLEKRLSSLEPVQIARLARIAEDMIGGLEEDESEEGEENEDVAIC